MAARKRAPKDVAPVDAPPQSPPTPPVDAMAPPERQCPPRGCSVLERVLWIVHLMAGWRWDSHTSVASLAVHWDVDEATVRKNSAEANRLLQFDPVDLDYERRRHRAFAEKIKRKALKSINWATGQPDLATALKANEQSARFGGIDISAPAVSVNAGQVVIQITQEVHAGLGLDPSNDDATAALPAAAQTH